MRNNLLPGVHGGNPSRRQRFARVRPGQPAHEDDGEWDENRVEGEDNDLPTATWSQFCSDIERAILTGPMLLKVFAVAVLIVFGWLAHRFSKSSTVSDLNLAVMIGIALVGSGFLYLQGLLSYYTPHGPDIDYKRPKLADIVGHVLWTRFMGSEVIHIAGEIQKDLDVRFSRFFWGGFVVVIVFFIAALYTNGIAYVAE
jgi:hypothetical protein